MQIFTIGHSNDSIEHFFETIREHEINTVVDVRSVPYSRYSSQFNKKNLEEFLRKRDFHYIYMGDNLGGRIKGLEFLTDEGLVDYSKVMKSPKFLQGISRLEDGVKKGFTIALLCAEKNPLKCHRFSLISRFLNQQGFEVFHIIDDKIIGHKDLEEKLLLYFEKKSPKVIPEIDEIINYKEIQLTIFNGKIDQNTLYKQINELISYNNKNLY